MTSSSGLIAGRFAVDFSRRLPDGGGGLAAFEVEGSLMAVQVQRASPARARAIQSLAKAGIDNLLGPIAHGGAVLPSGEAGYFVVTAAPLGAPLSAAMQPWPERELIDQVLRPAAAALVELEKLGVTHRAIRPDNVFLDGRRTQVSLGCAWAEAAGHRQPASLQPPYFTVCDVGGQGEGVIADDVYALGAMLVWLTLGRDPLAGLDDATIVQRKLDLGSFTALVGANRLPSTIADLARVMLADDPEMRPEPASLVDRAATPTRRSGARSAPRAQRSLELAGETVWTLRSLADVVRRKPVQCLPPLRQGGIGQWIRRSIGDIAVAGRLQEVLTAVASGSPGDQRRTDAATIMRVVAVIDPLAPFVWQGSAFWPDGLGAKLCHAISTMPGSLVGQGAVDAIAIEMIELWGLMRPKRVEHAESRAFARELQRSLFQKPLDQGVVRLCYAFNPLFPCASPLLARAWAIGLDDLLPAMEAAVATRDNDNDGALLDQDVLAFMTVRKSSKATPGFGQALLGMTSPTPLSTLRLLAELQSGSGAAPVPQLAGRLSHGVPAILKRYRSQARRVRLTERLAEVVRSGDLPLMLNLLDDPAEDDADAAGLVAAQTRIATIDQLISSLTPNPAAIKASAAQVGHDVALGAGMLAFGVALAIALFS